MNEHYWYCPKCDCEVPGTHVTYEEIHTTCGTGVVIKEYSTLPLTPEQIEKQADLFAEQNQDNGTGYYNTYSDLYKGYMAAGNFFSDIIDHRDAELSRMGLLLMEKDGQIESRDNEIERLKTALHQIATMSDPGSYEKAITDLKAIASKVINNNLPG